jgi:hypothetical protein
MIGLDILQAENINIPSEIDQLLDDYAKQFHVLRAPRKIMWKKNLGTVKVTRFPPVCVKNIFYCYEIFKKFSLLSLA